MSEDARREIIFNQLQNLIKEYFDLPDPLGSFPKDRIPLSVPSYGSEEVWGALESLLSGYVTMGKKVSTFEEAFAKYIGVQHGLMVNSGSTANLIALSILANPSLSNPIRPGEEIITPALTWSTTVWPILDIGAVPVFVDVLKEQFTIDPDKIRKAITPKTRAIMPVHLLGNPCDMTDICEIAEENDLYVIEDCCEAHGAKWNGRLVGSFGDLSTFSFFFSHHISTIEGGIVLGNNEDFDNIGRSLRAHGWVRERKDKENLLKQHRGYDSRFLFVNRGFNVRPMELQGAFGLYQLPRLEGFIAKRQENSRFWSVNLKNTFEWLEIQEEQPNTRHAWFGYPIGVKSAAPFSREALTAFLETKGVETRPVMAGNIVDQPGLKMFPYRIEGKLSNTEEIAKRFFFIGNHHGVTKQGRQIVIDAITEFTSRF